jgi:nucleotide-binding universal stress UspA family protein
MKKRFKKILVVVDESGKANAAVKRAVNVAAHCKASVRLIAVIDDTGWSTFARAGELSKYRREIGESVKRKLHRLEERFKKHKIKTSVRVRFGSPPTEVYNEAVGSKMHLVMKAATEDHGGFGAVARKLFRKCPCPVWIVRRKFSSRHEKILVAIDPVPGDDERNLLNEKVLDHAAEIAEFEGAELHVVHAYSQPPKIKTLAQAQAEQWKLHRKRVKDFFMTMVEPYGLDQYPSLLHLLPGKPADVIPKLVAKEGIELIVMGTVARTGVKGLVVGNTAETLLQRVNCSVLAVKPDGFHADVD